MLFLVVILLITLVGCAKTPVTPFEQNPDTFISESLQKDVDNADELREMYKHFRINSWLETETEAMNTFYGALSEEDQKTFALRGNMIVFLHYHYNEHESEFDKNLIDLTKNYLKASKLGDPVFDGTLEENIGKALIEKNPILATQTYLKENKIEITNLQLPDTFVSVDRWNYPMKGVYKYIVEGTMDGEPFEKEITQTFYFGANLEEVSDFTQANLLIEAIQ